MCDICESVSRILFLSLGLNYLEIILTFVSLSISFRTFGSRVLIKTKLSLVFKVFSRKIPIIGCNEFH